MILNYIDLPVHLQISLLPIDFVVQLVQLVAQSMIDLSLDSKEFNSVDFSCSSLYNYFSFCSLTTGSVIS